MKEQVKQVLLGSLLGDGYLTIPREGISARFVEQHTEKQKEYLLWKKEILSQEFEIKNYTNNQNYSIIQSKTSPILTEYHKIFYPNGKSRKVITIEILNQLTPLSLAVWYIDDGNYNYYSSTCSIGCKEAIKKLDKEKLKSLFIKKFSITISRIDKKRNGLCFNVKETKEFIDLIEDEIKQMPKCIHYKLGKDDKIRRKEKLKKIKNSKEYYQKNTEKLLIKKKKWRENNQEHIKKYSKNHWRINKEKIKKKKAIQKLKRKQKGLCSLCGKKRKNENYMVCDNCRAYHRDFYRKKYPLLKIKKCLFCGQKFKPTNRHHIYCSKNCKNKYGNRRRKYGIL